MLDSYSISFVYTYMRNKGNTMTCQKCKKIKADIKYHGGHYCTWYCAKKS